ncbi:uncharacterized protein [Miscanthus floridulus]|uniref:uncharacterized protein n=1 Tax=Miscanthus floridulus TaxID=154761 RepID=UPI00345934A6
MPLGPIDLPITFRDPFNYRMETLTFEVVRFPKTFHAILGHPCYMKFMAVPNYTYLKLKILGPSGVITVGTSFQHAYECEVEYYGHAIAIVASGELAAIKKEVTEEAPDTQKLIGSFEPVEGSKEVLIDLDSTKGKTVHVGTTFPLNRKARSLASSVLIDTSSCGNPRTCQAFRGNSSSIP